MSESKRNGPSVNKGIDPHLLGARPVSGYVPGYEFKPHNSVLKPLATSGHGPMLQVLKFGASIVDNLRQYDQPVFIYLPPYGDLRPGGGLRCPLWMSVGPPGEECRRALVSDRFPSTPAGSSALVGEKWSAIGPWYSSFPLPDPLGQATATACRRGGAWVVLDSKINAESIEMYADETSHAGVLEPSGPHHPPLSPMGRLKNTKWRGILRPPHLHPLIPSGVI